MSRPGRPGVASAKPSSHARCRPSTHSTRARHTPSFSMTCCAIRMAGVGYLHGSFDLSRELGDAAHRGGTMGFELTQDEVKSFTDEQKVAVMESLLIAVLADGKA